MGNNARVMPSPKIAFIGAGSQVFTKNLIGDILLRPRLSGASIAMMDIDPGRLEESEMMAKRISTELGGSAAITAHINRREALDGADFVVVCFQIGGYRPCTVTDFEIPRKFGLRQTIADSLGIGGIMRGLRTVPRLWEVCKDMRQVCPGALLLQHANPMAINTWAIAEKYPDIRQVGLCHSVQRTVEELARDIDSHAENIRHLAAGINHMAFYLKLGQIMPDGSLLDLYPVLREGHRSGKLPKPNRQMPRCPNNVRYEVMMRLGYFVTESSEHFAEYVPWFIKRGRPDLIEKFGIPLDEYLARCEESAAKWQDAADKFRSADQPEICDSGEYAASIINSVWTGAPSKFSGNTPNSGHILNLPDTCAVEVPCVADEKGIHPEAVGALPAHLAALIRSNVSVQELTVKALLDQNREHIYHAAMMDPHTAADLDLGQIWQLVDELVEAHGDWLPDWAQANSAQRRS